MSFLVRRKKVAKTAEVNAAPAPAVSGEQSDKSAWVLQNWRKSIIFINIYFVKFQEV